MLTDETATRYTVMNEADRIPALEELIIYSKGLQNTGLGQIQAKNGSYIFKALFKKKKNQRKIWNRKCACLQKPELFTIWLFIEKVCQPLG